MQTRTLLAAVATAAIAAIATPSLSSAQDTTKATTTSKGEVAMKPNFGSLISASNSGSTHTAHLKGMTTINATDVQLVNVEDLLKGNDVSALNNALTKNQANIDSLRTTLGANTTISGLFAPATATTSTSTSTATAASTTPSVNDVIAADVGTDGKVILYYWKKPAGSQ